MTCTSTSYMYKLYNDVAQQQVSSTSICLAFIMHTLRDFDDFPVLINDSYSIFCLFLFWIRKLARHLVRHENDDVITKQIMKFGNCLTAWRLGSSVTDFFAVTDQFSLHFNQVDWFGVLSRAQKRITKTLLFCLTVAGYNGGNLVIDCEGYILADIMRSCVRERENLTTTYYETARLIELYYQYSLEQFSCEMRRNGFHLCLFCFQNTVFNTRLPCC